MKQLIILLIFLILVFPVYAETRHMQLLAVTETEGNLTGSIADLYLDIVPGQNRVFIETFPLTRLDTQISTRFAKDVACELSNKDCSGLNFIYTIKADSAIVGGPSAGAALAILTAAALQNLPINEEVAITGTINSGGLIGPVSGIPEKMDAAAKAGIKKVLISKGTRNYKQYIPSAITTNITAANKTMNITLTKFLNKTVDLFEYGKKQNVTVTEVTDLNAALFEFTGKYLYENNKTITKESAYQSVMEEVASILCERRRVIQRLMPGVNSTYTRIAQELVERSEKAQEHHDSYSQASYCFAANAKLQAQNILLQNLSKQDIINNLQRIKNDVEDMQKETAQIPLETLTDMQTNIIVNERLDETISALELTQKIMATNASAIEQLAYTVERFQSVKAWTHFFGLPGKQFNVDRSATKEACQRKFAEAQERVQYVKTIFPAAGTADETLRSAQENYQKEKYLLCLHKAAKAKAEADVVLNTIGISDDFLKEYVEKKLVLVKDTIARTQEKGFFPIVGYSYWEYASALQDHDIYSALLFSEYALEMSDLKLYFQEKKNATPAGFLMLSIRSYTNEILFFAGGFVWGVIFAVVYRKLLRKSPKGNNK